MKVIVIEPGNPGQNTLDGLMAVLKILFPDEVGEDGVAVVATPRAAQLIILADVALADDDTVGKVETANPDDMSGTAWY